MWIVVSYLLFGCGWWFGGGYGGVVVVVVVVVWWWCGGDVRVVLVVLLAVMVALVKISLSFSSCKQKVPSSLKYRLVGPV